MRAPCIVVAQAGNVHTGRWTCWQIVPFVRERNGWLHVDGAFGMWAAASRPLRPMVAGAERPTRSPWTAKRLNTPYDCGVVCCAHPQAHREALTSRRTTSRPPGNGTRSFVPDESRRARATPVYAALRARSRWRG
jgi:glutamate/tyrosine decarboxylase-like PLP-dependent enzyme